MNKRKYVILVSGASGIVGYGILKSLRQIQDCYLIGSTIYEDSAANCFSDEVVIAPRTNSEEYYGWLLETIDKYKIDLLIPGIEIDMKLWNVWRNKIESKTRAIFLLNQCSLIKLCLNKWNFYEKLEDNNISCRIPTFFDENYFPPAFPVVMKPICGFASKGFVKINSKEEFEQNKHLLGASHILQPYIGDESNEYTVSCFFDKNGEQRAMISLRRKLSNLGYTEFAEVVSNELFADDIKQLANVFHPIGPTNFQFRREHNQNRLLEINPRISSSTSIRKLFGYNESKMCIDYFLKGLDVIQPAITNGKAIRYIEESIL